MKAASTDTFLYSRRADIGLGLVVEEKLRKKQRPTVGIEGRVRVQDCGE
jgi:hypothetical protein